MSHLGLDDIPSRREFDWSDKIKEKSDNGLKNNNKRNWLRREERKNSVDRLIETRRENHAYNR